MYGSTGMPASSRCSTDLPLSIDSESVKTRAVNVGVLERVIRRVPLVAQGKSGAQLERCWLDDGASVVVKHVDARHDWIMQATADDGRIGALWRNGVLARVPASIDHTVLDVQPSAGGGVVVVMRDVSAYLVPDEQIPILFHRHALTAAARLHVAFAGSPISQLCSLGDYYTFLSPAVCARFAAGHDVPRLAIEGWSRFDDIVAADVSQAIAALHADPTPLVEALLRRDCTLVHGDLKLANLGAQDDRLIVLDWGTLTTWAPPAVDYAWYLAINSAALGLDPAQVVDDVRHAEPDHDGRALGLALIGALMQLGWEKALGATADDVGTSQRELAGLAWWTTQVREALTLL